MTKNAPVLCRAVALLATISGVVVFGLIAPVVMGLIPRPPIPDPAPVIVLLVAYFSLIPLLLSLFYYLGKADRHHPLALIGIVCAIAGWIVWWGSYASKYGIGMEIGWVGFLIGMALLGYVFWKQSGIYSGLALANFAMCGLVFYLVSERRGGTIPLLSLVIALYLVWGGITLFKLLAKNGNFGHTSADLDE